MARRLRARDAGHQLPLPPGEVPRRRGSDRFKLPSGVGRALVTRGRGRRGPRRAQFRSAPTSDSAKRRPPSSLTGRVRAARGLFEHGEAHRRASPRERAFSHRSADQPVIFSALRQGRVVAWPGSSVLSSRNSPSRDSSRLTLAMRASVGSIGLARGDPPRGIVSFRRRRRSAPIPIRGPPVRTRGSPSARTTCRR